MDYHEFEKSLRWAEKQSEVFEIEKFYESYFPDVKKVTRVGSNTQKELNLQKQGIDTIIELQTGKRYFFDEKWRDRVYGDFFLEEYSVWPRPRFYNDWRRFLWIFPPRSSNLEPIRIGKYESVPRKYEGFLTRGWIHGKKITDYIAYIFEPSKEVNLIPFLLLQKAWDKHYLSWLRKYGRKVTSTKNRRTGMVWFTTGIPVPKSIVYKALCQQPQI